MIGIKLDGLDAAIKALAAKEIRITTATRSAVRAGNLLAQRRAHAQLSRYGYHPAGTPTPSPPGEPPARITGALRGSLKPTGPTPTPMGFTARMGPTVAYGRIQELGGVTGRNHATTLPPRPYMKPVHASLRTDGALRGIFIAAWRRAL